MITNNPKLHYPPVDKEKNAFVSLHPFKPVYNVPEGVEASFDGRVLRFTKGDKSIEHVVMLNFFLEAQAEGFITDLEMIHPIGLEIK